MIAAGTFITGEKLYYAPNFIGNPRISVILPTFCRGDNGMLERAVQSILKQTMDSLELIVVDDGSVDGTQTLMKRLLQEDNRILYIRNDINSGLPAIRINQGILHARGKYVAYQFDDDQWMPQAMEILLQKLEQTEGPALVYGNWEVLDSRNGTRAIRGQPFAYEKLLDGNFIANNSVLHHRSIFEKYGMYDCSLVMRRLCDWDLWIRWSSRLPFYYVEQLVSRVEAYVDHSLGKSFRLNELDCRIWASHDRDERLKPDTFAEYLVDDLSYFEDPDERRNVYNRHVLEWQLRHKATESAGPKGPKKRLIAVKNVYSASVPIMVENYARSAPEEFEFLFFHEQKLRYEWLRDGDILLLCRAAKENVLQILRRLRTEKRYVTVIYLLDDDMLHFYERGEPFSYLAPGTPMYRTVEEMLRLSDYLISCTESVDRDYKKYNPCGQAISLTNIQQRYLKTDCSDSGEKPFRIAFMGGSFREQEFSKIADDFARLSDEYGSAVSFEFWGYLPERMKSIVRSQVYYLPYTQSYYEYLNRLQGKQFDLFLAPLDMDKLSLGKSPIKLLESCVCSSIGLYSEHPVYDCITDGVNGYKVPQGGSWFDKIKQIIETPQEERKKVYQRALDTVLEEYTTEKRMPRFKRYIAMAELAHQLSGKAVGIALTNSERSMGDSLLLSVAQMLKENGIPVELLLSTESLLYQQREQLEQSHRIRVLPAGKLETGNERKHLVDAQELKIAILLCDSLFCVPMDKGITWVVCTGDEAPTHSTLEMENGRKPDGIFTSNPTTAAQWQDLLGCRTDFAGYSDKNRMFAQIYNALLELLAAKRKSAQNEPIDIKKTVAPSGSRSVDTRPIERDELVFSRGIAFHRTYYMISETQTISKIGIIFASDIPTCAANVKLKVSFGGRTLREASMPQSSLYFNEWAYFSFDPICGCVGRELRLDLEITYASSNGMLGVYEDRRKRTTLYRLLNKAGLPVKRKNVLYVDIR